MNLKESLIKEISEMQEGEPLLKELWEIVETKNEQKRTFKGRRVLRPEDVEQMDSLPFPPEPRWEEVWKRMEAEDKKE